MQGFDVLDFFLTRSHIRKSFSSFCLINLHILGKLLSPCLYLTVHNLDIFFILVHKKDAHERGTLEGY